LGGRRRVEAKRITADEVDAERRLLLEKLAELSRGGDASEAAIARRERIVARLAEIYGVRDAAPRASNPASTG
jgi:hypothetical protein